MNDDSVCYFKKCASPECTKSFFTENVQVMYCGSRCQNRAWYLRKLSREVKCMDAPYVPEKKCRIPTCNNNTPLNKLRKGRMSYCSDKCARAWERFYSKSAVKKTEQDKERKRIAAERKELAKKYNRSAEDVRAFGNCPDYSVMDIDPTIVFIDRKDLRLWKGW